MVRKGIGMKKEDLYPLIGKYLNGYKIVKIEEDIFIKGQINLWTDEVKENYFGDKSIVKFFVRPEGNTAKIYRELVDKENYQLKEEKRQLETLIKSLYLKAPLNQKQEELLNKILFNKEEK